MRAVRCACRGVLDLVAASTAPENLTVAKHLPQVSRVSVGQETSCDQVAGNSLSSILAGHAKEESFSAEYDSQVIVNKLYSSVVLVARYCVEVAIPLPSGASTVNRSVAK